MSPCPTNNTLGALLARALDEREAEAIAKHLDDCDACQRTMIAAVRGAAADVATSTLAGKPPARAPMNADQTLGRFVVRTLLGAGGMGHVYEAYDHELDRSIALKVLRPELAGASSVLAARLVRESRLMAKVVHPSVITVYDIGRDRDAVFIAMELVRGQTLGGYVAGEGPGWHEIVALYERAGQGLAAAHAVGVIHRDFKPDNVLVELATGRPQRVVVTDFGIARAAVESAVEAPIAGATAADRLTATGLTIGTPAYMAPEQLDGKQVDFRADVFAFAVSLWEALFGERPFRGATVKSIRAAMSAPPRAPGGVPRRLVRALERGLALDPAERWPDMAAFTRELARIRTRRTRVRLVAAATGLVALGLSAALAIGHAARTDPCSAGLDAFAAAYNAHRAELLRVVLARDPRLRDAVIAKLDGAAASWRDTQRATCHADSAPIQAATTTACLDARRSEVAGYVDDIVLDGPTWAAMLVGLIGDPAACAHPAPGLLLARVPDDPVLRRLVTLLRYRLFAGEALRDKQDFAGALAAARSTIPIAEHVWPPLYAEALYLLGTTQSLSGADADAIETLRRTAAVAETSHHDHIAANAWIQLAMSSSNDEGNAQRGLEYTTYARAALERAGNPPELVALYDYTYGITLVDLHRAREAEVALRESIDLSLHTPGSFTLPEAIQGLGYLYEEQGRYAAAVAEYRRALAQLPAGDGSSSAVDFRARLAIDLSLLGKADEAEAAAREALAIAVASNGEGNQNTDDARLQLVQVLGNVGKLDEALAQARISVDETLRLVGEHGERYATALREEAEILVAMKHARDAEPLVARACTIIAPKGGADTADDADCWYDDATALAGSGRPREALALLDKALPILTRTYGTPHPQVAVALVSRGAVERDLGNHAAARTDLEQGIAQLEQLEIDPGQVAAARVELAKELWHSDPARAGELVTAALAIFDAAPLVWKIARADARAWLAAHGRSRS